MNNSFMLITPLAIALILLNESCSNLADIDLLITTQTSGWTLNDFVKQQHMIFEDSRKEITQIRRRIGDLLCKALHV